MSKLFSWKVQISRVISDEIVINMETLYYLNPFPHTTILQQMTLDIFCQKISIIEWITYDKKWITLWQKEKLHVLCNFFFCHYVFKKLFAAEASENIYMRERVKQTTLKKKDHFYKQEYNKSNAERTPTLVCLFLRIKRGITE